jgi:hypothetical protein
LKLKLIPHRRVLAKLIVVQLLEKFSTFYGTQDWSCLMGKMAGKLHITTVL